MPVVARELSRLLGIDVAEELFRPHAVPHFLRLYLRIVDDKGKLVAEGRDVDTLLAQHGKAARAVWKTTAAPSAWEQRGLTTWSFGELPTFVTRSVGPLEVRSYPALVDQGTAVDLVLLEAAAEAEEATRLGVRRLLMLRAKGALSTIVPKLPAPLTKASGAPPAKDEDKLARATLLARVVDETFGLGPGASLPRTSAAFEALATEGTPRLYDTFVRLQALLEPIRVELDKTLRALKTASQQPSGKAAVVDLRQQLEHLVPLDLLAHVPLAVLPHYPRYLRAAQTRLTRAIADPRKDSDKLAPLAPLWTAFLAKRKAVRDRRAAEDLRWLFVELRVSIFAPELKTPVPVSVAKVSAALADLR